MAINKWNETLRHIYVGEGLDIIYTKKEIKPLTLQEYLFMIKETTAKFIQLSLILGALVSRKSQKEIEKIKDYGINLGIAFQIRDDFYDFENDIKERKQRIFVTKEALQKLNEREIEFIKKNYRKNPQEVINIIQKSEIPNYVKKLNNYYLDKAIQDLKALKGEHITRLKDIAEILRT